MLKSFLLVGLGGAIGSVLRYLFGIWLSKYGSNDFPWSTFTINIIGSFVMGLLLGYFSQNNSQPELKLLLVTGLCGGFTTFSAFTAENINLMQSAQWGLAFMYIISSIVFGLAAVFIGLIITR